MQPIQDTTTKFRLYLDTATIAPPPDCFPSAMTGKDGVTRIVLGVVQDQEMKPMEFAVAPGEPMPNMPANGRRMIVLLGHPVPDEVVYAVGVERKPGQFGMTHGPTPTLQRMLEVCSEPGGVLFKFTGEREEVLYRWKDGGWVEEKAVAQLTAGVPIDARGSGH